MEDLIKGELDWHNKVNENFHEVDSQMADIAVFAKSFWINGFTNWSPAIQNANDYLKTIGGGTIILPSGQLDISVNIGLDSNVKVTGQGFTINKTLLVPNDPTVTKIFYNKNNQDKYIEIENLCINCKSEDTSINASGIDFNNVSYYNIKKVFIFHSNNFLIGIRGDESLSHHGFVEKSIFDTTTTLTGIHDCLALGSSYTTIRDCSFINASDTGIGGQWGQSKSHHNITIDNCSFINCVLGIGFGPLATNVVKIINCYFSGNSLNMWINGCDDWKVYGNTFGNVTKTNTGNIRFETNTNIDMFDNTFGSKDAPCLSDDIVWISAQILAYGGSVFEGKSNTIKVHDNIIYGNGLNNGINAKSYGNVSNNVNGGQPTAEDLAKGTDFEGVEIYDNDCTNTCQIALSIQAQGICIFKDVKIKGNKRVLYYKIGGAYNDSADSNNSIDNLDSDIIGNQILDNQFVGIKYWFKTIFISYGSDVTMQRRLLKSGFNGQRKTIINNGTTIITIQDNGQNSPYYSNIKLKGSVTTLALNPNDILELIFNSATGLWHQI